MRLLHSLVHGVDHVARYDLYNTEASKKGSKPDMRAVELLESRVAELDQPTQNRLAWSRVRDYWEECAINNNTSFYDFENWPCKDLAYSVEVMNVTTDAGAIGKASMKRISAREADQIVASSDTLRRIAALYPEIVFGPVSIARQFWVATQNPQRRALGVVEPMQSEFRPVAEANRLYAKPREGGMFTSTGACGKPGMWRMYLDMYDPSMLHGKPWYTWMLRVQGNASIREVTCAEDWVRFVEAYSISKDGAVRPDWRKVSEEYDGVHITLRAITAIDGIEFECADGIISPPVWAVEQTLWLRWQFAGQSLVESTI